ncbi:MAG: hypothetical protein D3908_12115, partial [Candidatus Electrothrix sp. AUS4]|nr:hypothetical protein [Candidatus Electrothrix sp. AUS4]
MIEGLLVSWGATAAWGVFGPVLEDLAKGVAEDAAKSYVGKCFKSVFSVIHKDALIKATGLALKELLVLVEDEFIRADIEEERLPTWTEDLRRFVEQDRVCQAIADLFLKPEAILDPGTFALAWQELEGTQPLPDGFDWQFITKRFAVKVKA